MARNRESTFHFKHFSVKNNASAMKVGTDGVLLGAWCDVSESQRVLDVGSGTGLIALMIAQRCNADIIGIEIETNAYNESIENINNSPWSERISIINGDISDLFETISNYKIDHIVSNPPFFNNGILAPDKSRAMARHCDKLNFKSLIALGQATLPETGLISFISPYESHQEIIEATANNNLHIRKIVQVYSSPTHRQPVRLLWEVTKASHITTQHSELYIRTSEGIYTEKYRQLTKDFYLNF